jgi:hypothetical protein
MMQLLNTGWSRRGDLSGATINALGSAVRSVPVDFL